MYAWHALSASQKPFASPKVWQYSEAVMPPREKLYAVFPYFLAMY